MIDTKSIKDKRATGNSLLIATYEHFGASKANKD
jgi:hypothetical protein